MTKNKQYKGKGTNIFFLVLLIGLFVYFVVNAFGSGSAIGSAGSGSGSNLPSYYGDLLWIGTFASFVGAVIAYFNKNRGSQFLRGVTIGFLIGSFVLLGIVLVSNV